MTRYMYSQKLKSLRERLHFALLLLPIKNFAVKASVPQVEGVHSLQRHQPIQEAHQQLQWTY